MKQCYLDNLMRGGKPLPIELKMVLQHIIYSLENMVIWKEIIISFHSNHHIIRKVMETLEMSFKIEEMTYTSILKSKISIFISLLV